MGASVQKNKIIFGESNYVLDIMFSKILDFSCSDLIISVDSQKWGKQAFSKRLCVNVTVGVGLTCISGTC